MRVTFVTWDGGGNEPPAIGAAEALRERGHDVTFAGYESQRERLIRRGFAFAPLAGASGELAKRPPSKPMSAFVMASEAVGADVRRLLATDPPDVVVVDCLLFAALAAAEATTVPTVVFVHSAPNLLLPPGGLIDQFLGRDVARLRAGMALRPIETLQQTWAVGPVIATTIPEMDEHPTTGVRYVGPIVPSTVGPRWVSPWNPSDPRALIVASFTTGAEWDQRSRIERTLDALRSAPVRVLLTTGPVHSAGLDVPGNTVLARFVPHADVLPMAAAMVTHGGHGTVMAALAHGVPLACLPNPFSDQPAVAERVAELGAGISLDGEAASAADIREAVDQLRLDGSFAASAARLAERIKARPGAAGLGNLLEQIEAGANRRR